MSAGGIIARQIYGNDFPLNGTQIAFAASLIAVTLYVVVSLLTCREDFNMDRMLHRGKYALAVPVTEAEQPPKRKVTWGKVIGLDENFTRGDTLIAGSLFGWNLLWFVIFVVGSGWNLIAPWPDSAWSIFWHIAAVGLPVFISVVTAVWFTWGGVRDIRALFRHLRSQKVNHLDDGTVRGHENLDESELLDSLDQPSRAAEKIGTH